MKKSCKATMPFSGKESLIVGKSIEKLTFTMAFYLQRVNNRSLTVGGSKLPKQTFSKPTSYLAKLTFLR